MEISMFRKAPSSWTATTYPYLSLSLPRRIARSGGEWLTICNEQMNLIYMYVSIVPPGYVMYEIIIINIQRRYTTAVGSNNSLRKIAVFCIWKNLRHDIKQKWDLHSLYIDNYCTCREILHSAAPRAILLYSCNNYRYTTRVVSFLLRIS